MCRCTLMLFAILIAAACGMPTAHAQSNDGSDPFGGNPFGDRVKTKVVLMMKDVDKQVIRSWFNAYALKQSSSGMGGSSLGKADFEIDLERDPPETTELRVVLTVPKGMSDAEAAKRFQAVRLTALKYGVEANLQVAESDGLNSPTTVVRAVVSQQQHVDRSFKFWETLAKEISQSPPTIELFYQQPEPIADYGGDMMMGMGGGYGYDMGEGMDDMFVDFQQEPEPTGTIETGNMIVHWSEPNRRLAAVSKVSGQTTGDTAWIAIDVDLTDAGNVIAAEGVAGVRVGNRAYAFSSTRSRWDSVQVRTDDEWELTVPGGSTVKIQDGDDLHVFTDEAGRWMSLSGAKMQSRDEQPASKEDVSVDASEQSRWQQRVSGAQDRIDELVRMDKTELTTDQKSSLRKQLRELLAERDLATKQVRQWRGRAIVEQATQLMEEAEAAYKRAIEPASIDAEMDRLLR